MKKSIFIIILAIVIVFLTSISSDALRWGNDLIQTGEHSCVILRKFGEPIVREIIRKGVLKKHPRIEHWLYEKSYGFYHIFIFKDGILIEIKSFRK